MPQVDSRWRPAMVDNYGLHQLTLPQLLSLKALMQKVGARPQQRQIGAPLGAPILATPTPPRPRPSAPPVYTGPLTRTGMLQALLPQPAAPARSAFARSSVLAGIAAAPASARRRRPRPAPFAPQRSAIDY
jgi:hypothetical protein